MERIRLFTNDSVEYKGPLSLISEKDRKFLILNPFEFRVKEIDEFFSLPKNWDGYYAQSVNKEVYSNVKKVLALLNGDLIERIDDIYPNNHGTITIDWVNRQKEKLSLEIGQSSYSYFVKNLDQNPHFYNGQNILMDFKNLTSSLEDLFREEISRFIL